VHRLPVGDAGFAGRYLGLGRLALRLAGALDLALPQTLLSLAELLTRGFLLGEYRQRVPLGQVMKEVEQIGNAQAL